MYYNVKSVFFEIFNWMDCSDFEKLFDSMYDDIFEDIANTADPENWNDDDVRIAIRRVMFKKMGIE